jgi:hypothetical protein
MAYFLVRHEGAVYANAELYYTAIAGGERSFMKMLAEGTAVGKTILDQILYRTTEEQQRLCEAYAPKTQDFDEAFSRIERFVGEHTGRTIVVSKAFVPTLYRYGVFSFMKIRDLNKPEKYRMLPKLATVRVGQCSYVALDAVNTAVENPIVVTIGK